MKLTNHFLLTLALLNSSLIQADDSVTLSAVDEIHDQNVRFGNMFSTRKDTLGFSSPIQSAFAREYLLDRDPNAEGPAGPVCRSALSAPEPFSFLYRNVSPITFEMSRSSCQTNRRINLAAGSRFSYSRCGEIYDCTTARIKHLKIEDQVLANSILNEHAAKDFAKNFLKLKMESMEKLEVLNNFAHKRFNLDSKKCPSRFKAVESKGCNLDTLTKGFKRYQRKCTAPEVGCYLANDKYDIPAYLDFDKEFKAKNESSAQAYFNLRAEKISSQMAEKDKQYIQEMGEFVTSEKFKEASATEKEDLIINLIKDNNDPILATEYNRDSISIKLSSDFEKLRPIFLKQNITKDDFVQQFDKLRKERAESQISESCGDVPTLTNLCATVTSMRKGERSPVGMDNVTLSHYVDYEGNLSESEDLKKLKALMGEDFEDGDFELNLDAKRCFAFGYSDNSETSRKKAEDQKKQEDSAVATGIEEANTTGFGSTSSASRREKEEIVAKGGEDEPAEDSSKTSILPQVFPTEEAYTNNMLNPNAYNAVSNLPNKDNGDEADLSKTTDTTTTRTDSEASTANDARIADLVKKLSATEDRLEKLKASTEAAEEARVREKKIAEENALIADLRGQINDLKNKTQRPVEVQAPVARQEIVQAAPQSSNYSFGSGSSSVSKNNTSDSGEVSRTSSVDSGSQHSQSSSSSSVGRSIASSGSQLSLVNSDNGNDQTGALILTRVDGMSSEKAAETISNRILELNGVPFLIEEDGITKKVIPLIRDGKIELDENGMPKYVKIKVKSLACSKEDAEKGKCRAPAAIAKANSSVADEKRDEEEKARKELARAQYIKLKALTNEALKSKVKPQKP